MRSTSQSVTSLYAQALVQSAARLGLQLPPHLLQSLPAAGRVPLEAQDALWEAYCAGSADPLSGLKLGLALQIGHLDSIGMLLISCDTLGEALEHLKAYVPVVGEGGAMTLMQREASVFIDYQPLAMGSRCAERVEAVLACLLNLTRWATGGRFQADGLWLQHAPLAPFAEYQALVGCKVHGLAERNALSFSSDQLTLPLIQANGALHEHLRRLADQTLASLGPQSLVAAVQACVAQQPRWGKERVAEALGLSGRHLNRKLAEEGTHFKAVREMALQRLARNALAQGQRPVVLAEQLGFSDENAFVRAFRRWQGMSPAQFRSEQDQSRKTT